MSKKPIKLDPADKLLVGEVAPWAKEKHDRLRRYIQASHGARAKFLPPVGTGVQVTLSYTPVRAALSSKIQVRSSTAAH
jgi:hypothetical protein